MNIAIIGVGGMGTVHYHNYRHIPGAQVAAVVGRTDADRARAAEWGVPIFDTLTALCAAVPIDLVDICTPTFLHKELALEGFALGKHVITEKPIALTVADAQAMYAAAQNQQQPAGEPGTESAPQDAPAGDAADDDVVDAEIVDDEKDKK